MKFTSKYKTALVLKIESVFQANVTENHAEVAILISDNTDFKPKLFCRDDEAHFVLININCNGKQPYTKHQHTQFHKTGTTRCKYISWAQWKIDGNP